MFIPRRAHLKMGLAKIYPHYPPQAVGRPTVSEGKPQGQRDEKGKCVDKRNGGRRKETVWACKQATGKKGEKA